MTHGGSGDGTYGRPDGRWLVAVDVDGTLLDTEFDQVLRLREIEALESVRRAGHVVALCTGRNLNSTSSLLARSGWEPADLPMVLLNGAVVWAGEPRRRIACHVLDGDEVRALVRLFREHGTVPMVYGTDDDGGVLRHEARPVNDVLGRYLLGRRDNTGGLEVVEDLLACDWRQALEVGTIDEKPRIEALSRAIAQQLPGRVKVINTRSLLGGGLYYWAEAFHAASDKGAGLRTLAAHCGIAQARTVAIGDNFNDLDMFAWAGVSVAMAGSPREVAEQADYVTGEVAAGGAATVLHGIAAGTFPPAAHGPVRKETA
ncbi:MAG: HAD family phosphatase [bacterium]|nr:HAD family phosphatase [bacterium]